jgi:hypothetical protein
MWPPHIVNIDGLCGARQGSQKTQYVVLRHSRRQSLLRPIENVLIFKKQGHRHKGYEQPLGNEREHTIARAELAAKSGYNHRGMRHVKVVQVHLFSTQECLRFCSISFRLIKSQIVKSLRSLGRRKTRQGSTPPNLQPQKQ